jgi:hypothetical protein
MRIRTTRAKTLTQAHHYLLLDMVLLAFTYASPVPLLTTLCAIFSIAASVHAITLLVSAIFEHQHSTNNNIPTRLN